MAFDASQTGATTVAQSFISTIFPKFQQWLEEQGASFDDLDPDTDWKQLLKDAGFSTFEQGVLLKVIREKLTAKKFAVAAQGQY